MPAEEMPKALVHFNDYVSLAVMLLMLMALVGGRSSASDFAAQTASKTPVPAGLTVPFSIQIDGHIGDRAVKVGLAVVGDPGYFRGEDE
ncbi:MAG TPA: hypothetical protein PKH39_06425 [Woeseiaceae bacterium]|nr:hypothetical protein [Woeseiaceae bacterium]